MQLRTKEISASGVKIVLEENGQNVGRGFLYLLHNDLHQEPFGLMEDVFVEEAFRGKGYGEKITTSMFIISYYLKLTNLIIISYIIINSIN